MTTMSSPKMASLRASAGESPEPPCKRQKLSPPSQPTVQTEQNPSLNTMANNSKMTETTFESHLDKEVDAGILCFVNDSNPGFKGILKQRYTDFIVHEVTLDGKVVHLEQIGFPRQKTFGKAWDRSTAPAATVGAYLKATHPRPSKEAEAPEAGLHSQQNDERDITSKEATPKSEHLNAAPISPEDLATLDAYFTTEVREQIVQLYVKVIQQPNAKPSSLGSVSTNPIMDRQTRTQIHQDIRRIFESKLETVSDQDGTIRVLAAQRVQPSGRGNLAGMERNSNQNNRPRGKLGWTELGGEHLHFTLYKENKDTMEVVSFMARCLKMSPRSFAFAGTKDRRAITLQRLSVYRVHVEQLTNTNSMLYNAKVGDFRYESYPLALGDLKGNEFTVTLRDCYFNSPESAADSDILKFANKVVGEAVESMREHGFINYYGLQRFGTYSVGTHQIGKSILQGDFEGAVNAILAFSDEALALALDEVSAPAEDRNRMRDDLARALALHSFKKNPNDRLALDKMPKKFNAEVCIIRYLNKNPRDFLGALLQIQRNLRLMYVHAYQSFVWNWVASTRWSRFKDKVVEGDLVLIDSRLEDTNNPGDPEVDENGEIIVLPAAGDMAVAHDDQFERARSLSTEEASSGKYNIFDIVLPTPGWDINYPNNEIGDYYKEIMGGESGGGLDPARMRRPQKDFSLSGSYRKLMANIGGDLNYEVREYTDDLEQFVETDLDRLNKSKPNHRDHGQANLSRGAPDSRTQGYHSASEHNSLKHNIWKDLSNQLAKDDKEGSALHNAEKAKLAALPAGEPPQPIYRETFIQTSADEGQRTGHRETGFAFATNVAALESEEVSPVEKAAVDSSTVNLLLAENSLAGTSTVQTSTVAAPVPDQISAGPDAELEQQSSEQSNNMEKGKGKETDASTEVPQPKKIAVIVKFQLGSSQYATMALRELMKQGGVQNYKPEFSVKK